MTELRLVGKGKSPPPRDTSRWRCQQCGDLVDQHADAELEHCAREQIRYYRRAGML